MRTNNTDESNDDTDAESEQEKEKVLNEDKGDRQVEDEIHHEAAEEEWDNQDQEEEEDHEGGDTDSVKTVRQKNHSVRWWRKKSPCHFLTQR